MAIPFVIVMPFATKKKRQIILFGLVENMYPSSHGGRGGGSEVASAVDVVHDFSGAADGGDEVGPEVVGIEVMVLRAGAGAGKIGIDITWAANGGEEGGSGEVGGVDMVLGAGAGAEFQLAV